MPDPVVPRVRWVGDALAWSAMSTSIPRPGQHLPGAQPGIEPDRIHAEVDGLLTRARDAAAGDGHDRAVAISRPESIALAEYHAIRRTAVGIGVGVVGLAIGLGLWASRAITRPVLEIVSRVRLIGAFQDVFE